MHNPLQLNVAHALDRSGHSSASTGPQPWASRAQKGITALRFISVLGAGGASSPPSVTEIDAYARHTLAANGFGDANVGGGEQHAASVADLAVPAKHESLADRLVLIVERALRTLGEAVRRRRAKAEQRRLARETYLLLGGLDSHTLRDLGFDRSELTSVAAEAAGQVPATRARFIRAPHCPHA